MFKVYPLLNLGDLALQMRVVINIAGYFLTGVDDGGVVSIPQLQPDLGQRAVGCLF